MYKAKCHLLSPATFVEFLRNQIGELSLSRVESYNCSKSAMILNFEKSFSLIFKVVYSMYTCTVTWFYMTCL